MNMVFDLGNVFVRWNPRTYYKNIFNDDAKMEFFLANVFTHDRILDLDRGVTFKEAVAEMNAQFPDWAAYTNMYEAGWEKMFFGVIQGTVDILHELKAKKVPTFAITNWSHEKFPRALELFPFFNLFDGVVVSGVEKLVKPDPAIFELFLRRYDLKAKDCLFTDDLEVNVKGAESVGFHGHVFKNPEDLRLFLQRHQVLS